MHIVNATSGQCRSHYRSRWQHHKHCLSIMSFIVRKSPDIFSRPIYLFIYLFIYHKIVQKIHVKIKEWKKEKNINTCTTIATDQTPLKCTSVRNLKSSFTINNSQASTDLYDISGPILLIHIINKAQVKIGVGQITNSAFVLLAAVAA